MRTRKFLVVAVGAAAVCLSARVFEPRLGAAPNSFFTVTPSKDRLPLQIDNVRFEAGSHPDESAVLLKFDVSNTSPRTLTRPLLEITIFEKTSAAVLPKLRRALAGPFLLRAETVLEPGFIMTCELLLRNLTAPCRCDAEVTLVSVR
jgi:hypothetical protein